MKRKLSLLTLLNQCRKLGSDGIKLFFKVVFGGGDIFSIKLKNYPYPIHIRRSTSDIFTFFQIFCARNYDLDYGVMPNVIIDCGANVGYASVFLKKRFPDATIIAIEPEPSNFKMLEKNTAHFENVHLLNCGIWNKTAHLEIVDHGYGHWAFETREVEYEKDRTIEAISIADLMKKFDLAGIDILKIDVEGSEKELFEKNFETWLPATKVIVIELHDKIRKGSAKSFFKALCNYDFILKRKGENIICVLEQAKEIV